MKTYAARSRILKKLNARILRVVFEVVGPIVSVFEHGGTYCLVIHDIQTNFLQKVYKEIYTYIHTKHISNKLKIKSHKTHTHA